MRDIVTKADVSKWLTGYKEAWEDQDADQVVALFTPEAEYVENPFEPTMRGHDAIRAYWLEGAVSAQSDIRFHSTLWTVEEGVALVHWQAELKRTKTGTALNLDGVFRLTFTKPLGGANILCEKLQEWWFRDSASP